MKYAIEGMYWSAGDDIYVDTRDDDGSWTVVCLNDFIKDHIKENSNVAIVIYAESKE